MKLTASQLRQIIAEEYKDQSPEPNEYTDASKLTAIISSILKPEGKAPTSSETSPTGMINSYYTGANNPYAGMTISILDNDAVVMSPNGGVRRVFVNEHDTLEGAAKAVAENVKEFMLQIDDERVAEEILALPIGDFSSIPLPTYESKLTIRRLKKIIAEELELHAVMHDLSSMSSEEAYGLGYYAGKEQGDLDTTIVEEILQRKKTMKLTNEEVKVLDRYGNPLTPLFDHVFELKDETNRETFKGEGFAQARQSYREWLRNKGKGVSEDKVITLWGEDASGKPFGVWTHPDDRVPDKNYELKDWNRIKPTDDAEPTERDRLKGWAADAASRARYRGDGEVWAAAAADLSDHGLDDEAYFAKVAAVAKKALDQRTQRPRRGYRNESKLTLRRLKQIIVEEIVAETKKN